MSKHGNATHGVGQFGGGRAKIKHNTGDATTGHSKLKSGKKGKAKTHTGNSSTGVSQF